MGPAEITTEQQLDTLERRRRRSLDLELERLREIHEQTVSVLAAALELRDDQTGAHAERVAELALALTRRVAPELADDPALRTGFLLHDIGKIAVPDAILLKRGPLSTAERELMQEHTVLGEQLVGGAPHLHEAARDVILHHHERWDGTGYPWGLAGDAIPLAARIFAVADAFDAMTSKRPYRRPLRVAEAVRRIGEGAGTQFDPAVVAAFERLTEERYRHELEREGDR